MCRQETKSNSETYETFETNVTKETIVMKKEKDRRAYDMFMNETITQKELDDYVEDYYWTRAEYGEERAGLEFIHCDMAGLDFRELDIEGVTFTDCYLKDADFAFANLTGVSFEGSDLYGARFEFAVLNGADLKGTNLRFADFNNAEVDGKTKIPSEYLEQMVLNTDDITEEDVHGDTVDRELTLVVQTRPLV